MPCHKLQYGYKNISLIQRSPQVNDPFRVYPAVSAGRILKRLRSVLLAAHLTHLNSGGDHFETGYWKHSGKIQLQWGTPSPSTALPLTQSVGLAAAGADGQDSGVAPQLLLGGSAVRGGLLREAPQQVGPAGWRGFTSAIGSALQN